MSVKTKVLSTKVLYLQVCFNGLKNIPPKDFPSIDEMTKTIEDILPEIDKYIPKEYKDLMENIQKLRNDFSLEKITSEEATKLSNEYDALLRKYDITNQDNQTMIEFSKEAFNTFFQQFERWGKNWFNRLEDYMRFRKDMNKTNSEPIKE